MALNDRRLAFAVAMALVLALHPAAARMDVKVEFDKSAITSVTKAETA